MQYSLNFIRFDGIGFLLIENVEEFVEPGMEVAVAVQGSNDALRDLAVTRAERRHPHLPQKMFVQGGGLAVAAVKFESVMAAAVACRRRHMPGQAVLPFRIAEGGVNGFRQVAVPATLRQCLQARVEFPIIPRLFRLRGLRLFQQRIARQGFAQLAEQLAAGQLQQFNGMLKLRRHRQTLTDA